MKNQLPSANPTPGNQSGEGSTPVASAHDAPARSELALAEQALHESEARTRLLLEAADVGLWDWDLQTGATYFSPEWKRQIGYRDDEFANTFEAWKAQLHPDDVEPTLAAVEAFREGSRPHYDVEFRLRHKDGSWRWIFARANFVRDATGTPVRMLGSHTDFTERKLAHDALLASQQRLQFAQEATSDGIWDLNLTTGNVYLSPQWERLLGYAPGEVPQRVEFFYTLVHPDDVAKVNQQMEDHLAGRTAIKQDEVRLRTKSGAYRWFLDRGKVVARNASGVPERMVGTITDITERRQIEDALVARETTLRAIINASPVPMCLSDERQNITMLNPAFLRAFGYSIDKIPTLEDWWPRAYPDPAYRAQVVKGWESEMLRAQAAAVAIRPTEVTVRCLDGTSKTVLATATRLSQERKTQHLVVMYDITPQIVARRELQTSLLEKEALLKEVHHRVKNNLQVITSLLRLEGARSGQAATRAVLGDMQGRIRSMALLHESLYRSGTYASVDLGDYLRQLVTHAFRSQAHETNSVQLALDLDLLRVGMDQATPCGLLVNELISNCFKHAFPDGVPGEIRVMLRSEDNGRQGRLSVSDSGVGLPVDFETVRRKALGLQLVEDLASQAGGRLDIGPGSTFTVQFPVQDHPSNIPH